MKVQKSNNRPEQSLSTRGATGASGSITSAEGKTFDSFLQENKDRHMKEQLALMLEDIQRQGRILGESMSLKKLMIYKKSIAKFLDLSTKEMLEFRKEDYVDQHGRHNIYALVRRVDDNLESLTQELMSSQRDQLTILGYIDDIRGLLMDVQF